MPTVQELEDLFDSSDNSSGNDDSDDDDYRDDDDQPQGRQRSQQRTNESDEEKEEQKVETETEHLPDRPDHVEEDGHIPEDGQNYREPRSPFTGTLWNGRMNAFVRIDQENRRRPGGTRPQGYIWVESILAYRRTKMQTDLDEARLNENERNRQRPQGTQTNVLFGQEIPNATLLEISW